MMMTPDDVIGLPNGPELDALAATIVMGWTSVAQEDDRVVWNVGETSNLPHRHDWSPSTSIEHATELAERCRSRWLERSSRKYWEISSMKTPAWRVLILSPSRVTTRWGRPIRRHAHADGSTLARAITIAAIIDTMRGDDG